MAAVDRHRLWWRLHQRNHWAWSNQMASWLVVGYGTAPFIWLLTMIDPDHPWALRFIGWVQRRGHELAAWGEELDAEERKVFPE